MAGFLALYPKSKVFEHFLINILCCPNILNKISKIEKTILSLKLHGGFPITICSGKERDHWKEQKQQSHWKTQGTNIDMLKKQYAQNYVYGEEHSINSKRPDDEHHGLHTYFLPSFLPPPSGLPELTHFNYASH